MANKVSQEEIIKINELYYEYKNYSQVAKELGRTPATIKKYVDTDYVPKKKEKHYTFIPQELNPVPISWSISDNLGELCILTNEERRKIDGLYRLEKKLS